MDNGFTDKEWWAAYDDGYETYKETLWEYSDDSNPYSKYHEPAQYQAFIDGWNDAEFEDKY